MTKLNVAGDALLREGGLRHFGLDAPEPRARHEAVGGRGKYKQFWRENVNLNIKPVWVLCVVDGHEEGPCPVQIGQLQIQVGVIRL